MTDQPTDRDRQDRPSPEDGDAVATFDWLLEHVDRHVGELGDDDVAAVMAASWALGFAGATRQQVWWVLRDDRLRGAFGAMCTAMGRVRPGEVPLWLAGVAAMEPAARAALAARAQDLLSGSGVRVGADDVVLMTAVRGHPRTVVAPDGSYAAVPSDVIEELCAVARSVTADDIVRLLDRARPPFATRLAEAAAVASEKGLAFLARKARDAA